MTKTLATMMCAASMLGLEMTVSAALPGLVPVPAEMKEMAGKPFQVGARLKIGFGTVASEMPGGTAQPHPPPAFPPPAPVAHASGGCREPLQYRLWTCGSPSRLLAL